MKKSIVFLIHLYQRYLSPDHSVWARVMNRPPYCKYTPSCSDYMIESIEKKGAIRGLWKGIWRILRCNPWSHGGYDPVKEESVGLEVCRVHKVKE